jgi:hypothetical protein
MTRKAFTRAVQAALAAVAVGLASAVGMATDRTPASTVTSEQPSATPASAASPAPRLTRAQREDRRRSAATRALLERHGCWTDRAPAGVTPSHAVVTLPGGEPALVAAAIGFGIWLDGDPGVLHGFCP